MVDEHIERDLHNLDAALQQLGGVLATPDAAVRRSDEAAQAFEHAMDMVWAAARKALAAKGVEARLPRQLVHAASEHGWIEDTDLWLEMLKDEYELSASYDSLTRTRLFPRICMYHPELCRTHAVLMANAAND